MNTYVGNNFFDKFTIIIVSFPVGFSPLVVGSAPGMPPSLPWSQFLSMNEFIDKYDLSDT